MSGKNNLRDKLEEGELDLSMSQLVEVPVRVSRDTLIVNKCSHVSVSGN